MKKSAVLIFVFHISLLHGSLSASTETQRLRGVIDEALEAVYGECCAEMPLEEKEARVHAILEAEYDLNVIIRRSIGRNWRLMNEQEQQQVLDLVKQLVVRTYVNSMQGTARPEVELGDEILISDKRMEIPSTITLGETVYSVLYRLGRMRSGWQIYDIVAEDISVVSNYRQQIDDHFRKGNGQELIEKLTEQLTSDDLNEKL
jgi:phospholipid transport system substrate-binding protein